jgi:peptidoglycan/LPS O-acetylase OafA/YrhL
MTPSPNEQAAEVPVGHPVNNFDLLRLFAALLVFWFHTLAFTGRPAPTLFSWVTPGPLGVYIFFLISGYLVSKSWEADPHALRFLARRSLRIFPALAVLVLLTALVLGPMLTTLPLHAYFHDTLFRQYFYNIVLLPRFALPGVLEHQVIPNVVNGSLWSLPVEYTLYLTLLLLGILRAPRWAIAILVVAGCWLSIEWSMQRDSLVVVYGMIVQDVVQFGVYFLLGVCVSRFGLERWMTVTSVCAAAVLTIAAEPWPAASRIVSWVTFPAVFLTFGLSTSIAARALARLGDYSYGVYIYAFPVQQSVLYFLPSLSMTAYVLLSLVITFVFAAASWHLIEKRALRWKPRKPRDDSIHIHAASMAPPVFDEAVQA